MTSSARLVGRFAATVQVTSHWSIASPANSGLTRPKETTEVDCERVSRATDDACVSLMCELTILLSILKSTSPGHAANRAMLRTDSASYRTVDKSTGLCLPGIYDAYLHVLKVLNIACGERCATRKRNACNLRIAKVDLPSYFLARGS